MFIDRSKRFRKVHLFEYPCEPCSRSSCAGKGISRRTLDVTYSKKMFVNGLEITKEISRKFGYVMQDDVLHENLTVREVRTLENVV